MTFELPSGLPPAPWRAGETDFDAGWYVENDRCSFVCEVSEEVARAIASIPDMVEEIERLRERVANLESGLRGFESDCIELAAECEDADISPAERRTYRAFAASARAILAKTQEAAP